MAIVLLTLSVKTQKVKSAFYLRVSEWQNQDSKEPGLQGDSHMTPKLTHFQQMDEMNDQIWQTKFCNRLYKYQKTLHLCVDNGDLWQPVF